MSAAGVQHYIQRATDFFQGMQLTREDAIYRNSTALLAIHSAVSYCDALRIGLGDEKLASDDHSQAALSLKNLLNVKKVQIDGVKQLENLVAKKSLVAYGNKRLTDNDLKMLVNSAERFSVFANTVGAQLKIKGWHDDN